MQFLILIVVRTKINSKRLYSEKHNAYNIKTKTKI